MKMKACFFATFLKFWKSVWRNCDAPLVTLTSWKFHKNLLQAHVKNTPQKSCALRVFYGII